MNAEEAPSATELICGSCCAQTRSTGKFCSECGARLTHTSSPAEYKQVTLLFADVVRSMDLAATLDLERLREIMTEVVERSAAVLRRYGGTVEYHGDGVMAIFGAPTALEDHAFRACIAALAIQDDIKQLAAVVRRRDQAALQVRVGLNSGQVIAGEIGAGSLGYRATGKQVGLAQRMESVAPPGGVMLSESTALLVERAVRLAEPEWVHIKGVIEPVPARRLLAIDPHACSVGRTEADLVGRRQEMAALDALLERAINRHGGVVNVTGPPGIGKSRVAREIAAIARHRRVDVFWAFCESHATDVPFHAVTRLLREATGLTHLVGEEARARLRTTMPEADAQDLLLLDDLLGIADPDVPVPQIDPDTRRHRLTTLINTASLVRTKPVLYVIEDVHWIDAVSESLLGEFLAVIPRTSSMVLITNRPEYQGPLTRLVGIETMPLDSLGDSDTSALIGQLLGSHASVGELGLTIAERAAGNPFFAEEMVRELIQRGILDGEHGSYICRTDVAEVSVPATVQAAIGARVDRQPILAKRTLQAASIIGARFGAELLAALAMKPVFDTLVDAELIDQVRFTPSAEYAFRHPLIRAVVYESQLKTDRAEWHRRFAAVIEERAPESVEDNAALIAEHLEAAGELRAAYTWHMRAGAWLTNRDLTAARLSWRRASGIADLIPVDDPDHLSMRITPRTMLCATDLQAREAQESQSRFAELRELCRTAGDEVSLAIGMSGPATELLYAGRVREAAKLSSQQRALLESMDDPTPAMALAATAFCCWHGVLDFNQVLQWAQTIVDLAAGDPVKGAGYGIGSPLAIALAWRGTARWCLGGPGWRSDLHDAVALARQSNAETLSGAIAWTYGMAMQYGALRADASLLCAAEEAVQTAQCASNDRAMGLAAYTLAVGMLLQDDAADRRRGLDLMLMTREIWLRRRILFLIPVTDVWAAQESVRRGDRDASIKALRRAVDELGVGYPFYCVWATGVLVETLLARGTQGDLAEAHEAVNWLAALAAENDSVLFEITLLRLRALLTRAYGDETAYLDLAGRYRQCAESLGFEGHLAWARAMTDGRR
ncbi:adenylate/guanylate cyclase family protein [Mycolicibacterium aurum]|uniref:Adenylate/guanylate cyclase family protein n=1 Tax=Mycolicibacterium aurum TaxID=1791 RepID=A0A3S4TZH9_MYCAU|nr:adenylate/guanylate cyclase family protein [Mycolicibacterium aurum]